MRFYRIERKDDGQPGFDACLKMLADIESDDDRVREVAEVEIGSTSLHCKGKLFSGDLFRRQATNLPSLSVRKKPLTKLQLPEGGALAHHTAFIYEPTAAMLGYQMSKNSVSMDRFNLYISDICGCGTFRFVPVIHPAQIQALSRMRPKTFKIKVADPHDLEAVEDDQKETRESLIHLRECMDGAYVRITIGMGGKKGILDRLTLRSTIAWLLEQKGKGKGKVQVMQVEGKNLDDSKADPLDFLKAHVGAEDKIDVEGLEPPQNFQHRLAFMKKAYATNEPLLKKFVKAST